MKDLINIFLMAVVVLGWAMLEVTGWCYAVLAIPVVYWLKPVLDLLHKNYWVCLAFWWPCLLGRELLLEGCSMACSLHQRTRLRAM